MSIYKGTQLISGVSPLVVQGARNIGQIIQSTIPIVDAGLHLLDGALIQGGGIYNDFISYIANLYDINANYFCSEADWQSSVTTYGVCGKFVYNNTNNTVRLPKITGFTEGTTDVTALGDLVEAGLPNITGNFHVNTDWGNNSTSGCVYGSPDGQRHGEGLNSGTRFYVDASRSSSIYGNSSTVQPQSIKVLYYIVIATSAKTDIQADIDEIATDLNGKADVDLTNVNNSGTSKGAGWAMPSDTYEDLTLGASGTTYTAPANGYYFLHKRSSNSGQDIDLVNITSSNLSVVILSSGGSQDLKAFVPAFKNDIVQVHYNAGGSTYYFRFIYAKGSESEA